jgi:hypothetical protein
MSIAAYLAKLAEGLSSAGVLGISRGGTGVTNPGPSGSVLVSSGTAWQIQSLPKYINLTMAGSITAPFTGVAKFYPPVSVTIDTVYANIALNATGGPLTFSVNKNGASVIVGTIAQGTSVMTPLSASVIVTTADYLTLDVGGTAANARDLYVRLKYV